MKNNENSALQLVIVINMQFSLCSSFSLTQYMSLQSYISQWEDVSVMKTKEHLMEDEFRHAFSNQPKVRILMEDDIPELANIRQNHLYISINSIDWLLKSISVNDSRSLDLFDKGFWMFRQTPKNENYLKMIKPGLLTYVKYISI